MVEVPAVEEALGTFATGVRKMLIDVVRARHDGFAAAHARSGSRFAIAFGAQWRDLLIDTNEAFARCGFQTHKLQPAGHPLPVVNGALIYVWRMPESSRTENFASSPTKRSGFAAAPPPPMLFEPGFPDEAENVNVNVDADLMPGPAQVLVQSGTLMPLVLVTVRSSPRQLVSIDWAIAELDPRTGLVTLRGEERIWQPELVEAAATLPDADRFDAGKPVEPLVQPREAEGAGPDA